MPPPLKAARTEEEEEKSGSLFGDDDDLGLGIAPCHLRMITEENVVEQLFTQVGVLRLRDEETFNEMRKAGFLKRVENLKRSVDALSREVEEVFAGGVVVTSPLPRLKAYEQLKSSVSKWGEMKGYAFCGPTVKRERYFDEWPHIGPDPLLSSVSLRGSVGIGRDIKPERGKRGHAFIRSPSSVAVVFQAFASGTWKTVFNPHGGDYDVEDTAEFGRGDFRFVPWPYSGGKEVYTPNDSSSDVERIARFKGYVPLSSNATDYEIAAHVLPFNSEYMSGVTTCEDLPSVKMVIDGKSLERLLVQAQEDVADLAEEYLYNVDEDDEDSPWIQRVGDSPITKETTPWVKLYSAAQISVPLSPGALVALLKSDSKDVEDGKVFLRAFVEDVDREGEGETSPELFVRLERAAE